MKMRVALVTALLLLSTASPFAQGGGGGGGAVAAELEEVEGAAPLAERPELREVRAEQARAVQERGQVPMREWVAVLQAAPGVHQLVPPIRIPLLLRAPVRAALAGLAVPEQGRPTLTKSAKPPPLAVPNQTSSSAGGYWLVSKNWIPERSWVRMRLASLTLPLAKP